MIIPSQRTYLLLLVGIAIAIFLATFVNRNVSILATLTYDLIILGLALVDGIKVKPQRVEIHRDRLGKLSITRDNLIAFKIQGKAAPASLKIQDNYPSQFKASETTLETTIPPHGHQEITYTVYPHSRGAYDWGDLQVRQLGKWKLGWYDWKIPASQKVLVYPDLIGLRSLSIRLTLQNTGSMRQKRTGMGTEFAELREYAIGDDPRLIDWKATARRNRPLIRELELEREQTLIILLDRGRLMTAQVEGLPRFDWGLNSTLSLALAGLTRGDRVGIGVFDREVAAWIPPERGQNQLSKIVEHLTPIQPVILEPDYVGAVTNLVDRQTRRALVVVITDIIDATASAELLAAMARLTPRYLPFCVALRDPLVDRVAHDTSQLTVESAYHRAVALDILSQRQVALAQLKAKGVLVLDAPANRVSEELVDGYLRLKTRNLL
jgi:uncharacterized protein (DUF58 family)